MTLAEFIKTKRECNAAQFAEIVGPEYESDSALSYLIYSGDCWIEKRANGFHLHIETSEWDSADLSALELILWQWQAELTPVTLADEFARLIRSEFSADQLAEIVRRNALPEYAGSCATHDYTDSNLIMLQAWETLTLDDFDSASDSHFAIWNEAWNIAHGKGFSE